MEDCIARRFCWRRSNTRSLAALAQQENRSLSDKVREIINRYLAEQDAEAQLSRELNALGALNRIREQTALAYGVYAGDPWPRTAPPSEGGK